MRMKIIIIYSMNLHILSVVGCVPSLVNYLLIISYYTYMICKPIIDSYVYKILLLKMNNYNIIDNITFKFYY